MFGVSQKHCYVVFTVVMIVYVAGVGAVIFIESTFDFWYKIFDILLSYDFHILVLNMISIKQPDLQCRFKQCSFYSFIFLCLSVITVWSVNAYPLMEHWLLTPKPKEMISRGKFAERRKFKGFQGCYNQLHFFHDIKTNCENIVWTSSNAPKSIAEL